MSESRDLTSYLLGERSELRPLIEAIAEAGDSRGRERAALEYLLVLASARQAARGEPPEARALSQIRSRYYKVIAREDSEHARILGELLSSLQLGSPIALVTALKLLGLYHRKLGAFNLARASFMVGVEVSRQLPDPLEQLNSLFWLGVVERYLGNLDEAERVHREQLDRAREARNRGQMVLAQENLGLVALRRGHVADAREKVERALNEATALQDRELEGYCYHALMVVETTAGRPGEAASHGWEAYHRYESSEQRLRALGDCGAILFRAGLFTAARAAFEIVEARSADAVPRIHARINLAEVATALRSREDFDAASRQLQGEDKLGALPLERLTAYRTLGLGYAAFGEVDRGRGYLEASLALAEEKGFGTEADQIREELGGLPEALRPYAPMRPPEREYEQLESVGRDILAERARAIA